MITSSTPSLTEFEPLPQQLEVIKHVRIGADYTKGTHEVLLSGSVGSAKSITLAHIISTHCLFNAGSRVGIGRLALPQLKATLCQKIREHLFESGIDFFYHESTGHFDLPNRAQIRAVSWADGNLAKLGSMEFSAFAIEELTETKDPRVYDVIMQRTNRLPHVKEPWVLSATNPDSPSHWVYKKIIESKSEKVKVFYSNTYDNPYLDRSYIDTLKERLDPKMARRMIYGEWVEIDTERLYYSYDKARNYRDYSYQIKPHLPIILTYDFNIGEGKPLSLVFSQYDTLLDEWHFFNEVIIEGQRTLESLDEAFARGLLNHPAFLVRGDCNGRNKDTRTFSNDYDLIEKFLSKLKYKDQPVRFKIEVPKSNPALRERHNVVNAYMLNDAGKSRLFVYKDAPTVDEGFRLTKLKASSQYLEDDSDRFQHCTTACGYAIMYELQMRSYFGGTYKQIGSF